MRISITWLVCYDFYYGSLISISRNNLSFDYLCLNIGKIFCYQVIFNTLNIKPFQIPFPWVSQCFFILILIKFYAGSILNQIPDYVTFVLKNLVLSCDFECLKCYIERTFMLLEALAFQSCGSWCILDHWF